ncbi:MAG: hypothetical protein NVS1B16_08030 [Pseudarthrobacter sp.]
MLREGGGLPRAVPPRASWSAITYDRNDNLTGAATSMIQPDGTTRSWTQINSYTPINMLASAQGPGETTPVAFRPDDAGNMANSRTASAAYSNNRLQSQTANGTGIVTTFGYNGVGEQITETTGAAVTTTAYDAAGRPSVVTSPDHSAVSFTYDATGRMVSRQASVSNTVELNFYGGTSSQMVETTDASGAPTTRYLLDSSGQPIAQQSNSPSAGTWASYVTDLHNNLSQLLSLTGSVEATYAYDVFGNDITATTTSPVAGWSSRLKFQMAPKDPTLGLYNLGSRLLNPAIGRFTSADNFVASLGDLALQMDPLTGNRYLYAGANPAGMFDDGHWGFSSLVKLAKKAINNSIVRDIATIAIAGAVCGATAGVGCVLVAGAIAGAALKVASYQVNSAHHSLGGYLAAGATGGIEGTIAIAPGARGAASVEKAVAEDEATRLAARAAEIHKALDPIAQAHRTPAVLGTVEGSDVIAGGVRDLTPGQRALARAGDILGKAPGSHAEITALKAASEAGLTPSGIATTTNICSACRSALEESGASITGPRSASWQPQ